MQAGRLPGEELAHIRNNLASTALSFIGGAGEGVGKWRGICKAEDGRLYYVAPDGSTQWARPGAFDLLAPQDDAAGRIFRLWRVCGHERALSSSFLFAAVMAADPAAAWRAQNPFLSDDMADLLVAGAYRVMLIATRLGHVQRMLAAHTAVPDLLDAVGFRTQTAAAVAGDADAADVLLCTRPDLGLMWLARELLDTCCT